MNKIIYQYNYIQLENLNLIKIYLNLYLLKGIKNIELFALSDFDEKELKDLLQEFNLSSMSAHISFESLENLKEIINKIKFLNIKHAIIPAPKVEYLEKILRIFLI